MSEPIPQNRLIIYLLLLGFLPVVFALWWNHAQTKELNFLRISIGETENAALLQESKQMVNLSVIENFRNGDRFYIDKNIEPIPLLQPELEVLKNISKQSNFIENESVKNRLDFLQSKNKIKFAEGSVQTYPLFSETLETLDQPIQVNVDDLTHILSMIEGVPIDTHTPITNPPQLIITDFKIEKKEDSGNETYLLNLKLLKREFN